MRVEVSVGFGWADLWYLGPCFLATERSDRAESRRLDLQALLGVAVLRDLGR